MVSWTLPTGTTPGVFPFADDLQDPDFKHPTAYNWSVGVQRELPWRSSTTVDYVGRRGLYLQRERNLNQLPVGTRFANPGVNVDALRPYPGFSTIRLSENAGKSQLQRPAGQRRPPLHRRPEARHGLHARRSWRAMRTTSATSSRTPTTTRGTGRCRASNRTHVLQFPLHLRPAVLRELTRACSGRLWVAGRFRALPSSSRANRCR